MESPLRDPAFEVEAKGLAPESGCAAVFVMEQALKDAAAFSAASPDREVGGFLVGGYHSCGGADYTLVERFLRAMDAKSRPASLVFTHDCFEAAWREIARSPNPSGRPQFLVGWHHSHPGLGTFLSGNDLFIQRHFFNLPWQIALVVDPRGGKLELFGWKGHEIAGRGFYLARLRQASGR